MSFQGARQWVPRSAKVLKTTTTLRSCLWAIDQYDLTDRSNDAEVQTHGLAFAGKHELSTTSSVVSLRLFAATFFFNDYLIKEISFEYKVYFNVFPLIVVPFWGASILKKCFSSIIAIVVNISLLLVQDWHHRTHIGKVNRDSLIATLNVVHLSSRIIRLALAGM